MTFNQINYFLAFAETMNYTHAATGLFVTQSTLSRSIASLESELGVDLIDKSNPRTMRLTAAGELLYNEMRGVMDTTNDIIRRVRETDEKKKKFLKVGILEGQEIDRCVLYAIKDMADTYPEFNVEIKKSSFSDSFDKLKSHELDMMLTVVSRDDTIPEEFDFLPLKELPRYLAAKKDDPIWDQPVSFRSIDKRSVIIPSEYYPGDSDVLCRIEEEGMQIKKLDANDTETQRVLLESGVGLIVCNSGSVFVSRTGRQLLRTAPLKELSALSLGLLRNKDCRSSLMDYFMQRTEYANGVITSDAEKSV